MPDPRPKKKLPVDLKSLARSYTDMCVNQLVGIAKNGSSDNARVSAIGILLDRGWGRAEQVHTGADGGDIQITIRNILEEKKRK